MKKSLFVASLVLCLVACGATAMAANPITTAPAIGSDPITAGKPAEGNDSNYAIADDVTGRPMTYLSPSPAESCPGTDVGVIDAAFITVLSGNTLGWLNDWENDGASCSYGSGGSDNLVKFQVNATGRWIIDMGNYFTIVGLPPSQTAFDSSIMLRRAGSPDPCWNSTWYACDGDHTGAPPWLSTLFDVRLCAGEDYYLVVDGYGNLDSGPWDAMFLLNWSDECEGNPANDQGELNAGGGVISGDTSGATNNFENDGDACGYDMGGVSGNDDLYSFTVPSDGRWCFDTCGVGPMAAGSAGWDTSLMLRTGDTGCCPGSWLACNGDACATWQSTVDSFMAAGTTYYLVVDGWSAYTAGAYDVEYWDCSCVDDAECDDGETCNGIEQCNPVTGYCEPGPPACAPHQTCDPVTNQCVDPDPCLAYLDNGDSGWTSTGSCLDRWKMDEVELRAGAGRELVSYKFYVRSRHYWDPINPPNGDPFSVDMELWTVAGDGSCLPDAPIADTSCTLTGYVSTTGDPPDEMLCVPAGSGSVVLPDNSADPNRCGVDFFVAEKMLTKVGGFAISNHTTQRIGGPGMDDDFGISVVAFENCTGGVGDGTFGYSWFGDDVLYPADFALLEICTTPLGTCCSGLRGADCAITSEADCTGSWTGDTISDPSACGGVEACCDLAAGTCYDADALCCAAAGGTPMGPGSSCGGTEACCFGDNSCTDADVICCLANGGTPEGPGTACGGAMEACCLASGLCTMADPTCCVEELGGTPAGAGTSCEGDNDGDGLDGTCGDNCPTDPKKLDPQECGCNSPQGAEDDDDGDGVVNCNDQCAGVDDTVFAPECVGAIPTVSEWGLVILALLLLVAGKVYFGRRVATS